MSVAFSPGICSAETLIAEDDQPEHDRADERADERADDPAPEAVGQEDREVPDRKPHHHPAEHAHQRDLPCRWLRRPLARRLFWRGLGWSLRTRSSGVRSAVGSRSGAGCCLGSGSGASLGGDGPARPPCPRARCRGRGPVPGTRPCEICWPGSSGAVSRPRRERRRFCVGLDLVGRAADGRRVGGHRAELAHDPRAAGAVAGLALLPVRQHRRGDEDRRVRAGGDPDQQREREVLQRRAAEDQQRQHRQQRAEARRQRPGQHLGHRAVDDLRERRAAACAARSRGRGRTR